jgi:Protein of unknown function (DUF1488)
VITGRVQTQAVPNKMLVPGVGWADGYGIQQRRCISKPLAFLRTAGHDFETATYRFVTVDGLSEVRCGVSDAAMDDAEHVKNVRANQREQQFERLKDRILACAEHKYFAEEFEAAGHIMIRSTDLAPRR